MTTTQVATQQLLDLLYECLAEVNLERLDEDQLACDPSTVLFGDDAALDSMDLVRLVVLFEQKITDVLETELSLTDDRAMSEQNRPFGSVASLVGYAERLLKEGPDGR